MISGCGVCEKNRPERAITVSRLRDISTILERNEAIKAIDESVKCAGCGAAYDSKRSIAALRKTLSDKGATEATLAALNFCVRCKQTALIRPFRRRLQI